MTIKRAKMVKKPKFFLIAVICFLISAISGYSEEELTITTYYPSPYGSYRELETEFLYFREGTATNRGIIAFRDSNNQYIQRLRITAGESDTGNNDQGASIDLHGNHYSGGGRLDLVAGRDSYISFWTSPTGIDAQERMRITNTGNVGINATSPNAKLDVRPSDFSRPTNLCVRVNYNKESGARNCPNGYYIVMGSAAPVVTPPPLPGYIICCQACEDGGRGGTVDDPPDGICD
jgi:hypothetical protein